MSQGLTETSRRNTFVGMNKVSRTNMVNRANEVVPHWRDFPEAILRYAAGVVPRRCLNVRVKWA